MPDDLTPRQTIDLLRAKAAELQAAANPPSGRHLAVESLPRLAADIALIARVLADHIEAGE